MSKLAHPALRNPKLKELIGYWTEILMDPVKFVRLLYGWSQLSPKQLELLMLDNDINVILAGRRFGKTSLMAAKVLRWALLNPGTVSMVVGPSREQAKIYYDLLLTAFEGRSMSVWVQAVKQSPHPGIELINGSQVLFRSASKTGSYLRGRKVHMIVITEAAFLSESVFEQVIMPMRLDTRAKIFLESTPFGHNYFYKLFLRGLNGEKGISSFHATVYDNYSLSREEIERQRQRTPEFVWRTEYLAEFIDDEDTVFSYQLLENVFEDYELVGKKPGHKYVIGLDIAQKEDYTVFVVLDITQVPYKIADFRRFNKTTYDDIIVLANELSAIYNAPVYVDNTTVGRPVAEKITNAVKINFTLRRKSELIDNLLLLMERKMLKLPTSLTVLRDELRFFKRELTSLKFRVPSYNGVFYHDDAVIALALAAFGAADNVVGSFSVDLW